MDHGVANSAQRPSATDVQRGRQAMRPSQIPWKGWLDVLWRVFNEIEKDDILQVAAGVAFWGLFALFPALIATVSLYGLVADPADVVQQTNAISRALPPSARSVIAGQLTSIAQSSSADLTFGLILSLTIAFFSASSGVAALMRGINTAYDERETRGWLRQRLLAIGFTITISLFVVVAVSLITWLPLLLEAIGLAGFTRTFIWLVRWPALGLAVMVGLAILYRYAPNRTAPKWPWVTWGAGFATAIWISTSVSFAIYVENFGRFNETYGTLGGVIVLLLWMYISSLAILIGAELNSELEHQTAEDSTLDPPLPMGQREATVADNLGQGRPKAERRGLRQTLLETLSDLNRPGRKKKVQ